MGTQGLTQELLNELFEYQDGELYWKKTLNPNRVKVGSKAGSPGHGRCGLLYMNVKLYGKQYRTHRLIFMMHHGYLPEVVDHINNNTLDNRIENLRACTYLQNNYNRKTKKKPKSGVRNVYARRGGYEVYLSVLGKQEYFGYYKDLELAELVASEARNKFHGTYANHG